MCTHSVTASTLENSHALQLWWQPSSDTGSVWRTAQWFESSQPDWSCFFFFFLFNQGLPFKRANHQSNTRISYTETLWVKSAVSLLPLHKRPHTFQWRACPWISAQFSDLILVLWQHSGSRGLDGWTVVRRGGLVNQGRSKVSLGLFVLLIFCSLGVVAY